MRQLSTRDQLKKKLTAALGHCTAFDNEQSPYNTTYILSYKRPRNHKCKTNQMRKLTA